MSRYIEDALLSCKSMEELESMKQAVLKLRAEEDLKANCHHPIAFYIDTVYCYESFHENMCLRCGQVVEDAYKIMYSENSKVKNSDMARILNLLYRKLMAEGMEDADITGDILKFYEFMKEQETLSDIDVTNPEVLKKAIFDDYEVYRKIKNILKRRKKNNK